MLDRSHRFHGYNALNFAYQKGQTARGSQISLKYVLNPRRRSYRVAVVVSKKVSKSAVVRNRIRRRIYETVRLQATAINAPYDLVFTVYAEEVASMEAQQLQNSIKRLLQQSGALTSVTS